MSTMPGRAGFTQKVRFCRRCGGGGGGKRGRSVGRFWFGNLSVCFFVCFFPAHLLVTEIPFALDNIHSFKEHADFSSNQLVIFLSTIGNFVFNGFLRNYKFLLQCLIAKHFQEQNVVKLYICHYFVKDNVFALNIIDDRSKRLFYVPLTACCQNYRWGLQIFVLLSTWRYATLLNFCNLPKSNFIAVRPPFAPLEFIIIFCLSHRGTKFPCALI